MAGIRAPQQIAVGARSKKTAANQNIADSAETAITFPDGASFDVGTGSRMYAAGSPTKLTCRVGGVYIIWASLRFAANATGVRRALLRVNGGTYLGQSPPVPGTAAIATFVQVVAIAKLNVGDYVEVTAIQTSGAGLDVQADAENVGFAACLWGTA